MINFSIEVYLVINSLCYKSVRGFLKGMLLLFIYSSQLVVLYNSNFVAFLALLRFLCCKTSSNSKSPYALGFVVVTEIIYSPYDGEGNWNSCGELLVGTFLLICWLVCFPISSILRIALTASTKFQLPARILIFSLVSELKVWQVTHQ